MNIDRLIKLYKLSIKQVENINIILNECKLQNVIDKRQIAYILATIKHETGNTFAPVREIGGLNYFIRKYWTNSKVAKWLGNDNANDAAKYYGRGHCQITGESHYEKFTKILKVDLVNNPDLALNPIISAKIAIYGMKHGSFTGVKLDDYFNTKANFPVLARKIINGLDKSELIASYHRGILQTLI